MTYKYLLFSVLALLLIGCVQTKQVDYSKSIQQLTDSNKILVEQVASLEQRIQNIEKVKTSGGTFDEQQAKLVLINFFDALAREDYQSAAELFDPLLESGDNWFLTTPYRDPEKSTPAEVFTYYCSATGTCLRTEILETKSTSNSQYIFRVQFRQKDNSIYVFGPCCGATEEQMPSETEFEYTVKKVYGQFKVNTPPLYRP